MAEFKNGRPVLNASAADFTISTTNFDGILGGTDTDVQTALDTIDDHLHDGQTLQCDGIISDGGAFAFTTSGDITMNQNLIVSGGGQFDAGILLVGTADTVYGYLALYGHATGSDQGGLIIMQTAADHDTTISDFRMQVNQDDLIIGPATDTDALKLDANKDLYVTDGDIRIQTGGTTLIELEAESGTGGNVRIGQEDTLRGSLALWGHGTGSVVGGFITLDAAADHDASIDNWVIAANEDDFFIGPNTDTDALKLDNNKDFYITAGSLILPASEYVNFGGTQGSGGYGMRDNAGTIEKKDSGGAWAALAGHAYTSRGNPSSADWEVGDLTTDGNYNTLDMSAIVPAGAVAAHLSVFVQDGTVNNLFFMKQNGGNDYSISSLYTQVANQVIPGNFIVLMDANRVCQYYATNTTWTAISITVMGWWI